MNKTDLINAIGTKTGLSKNDSKKALEAFLQVVSTQLVNGENVRIAGFGSFKVTHRAARKGIIPTTKAIIDIPAKKVAKFSVAAELADAVN
jgi:DNA-binding protein HU-beta